MTSSSSPAPFWNLRGGVEKRSAYSKDAWVKRYSDHGMIWVEVG